MIPALEVLYYGVLKSNSDARTVSDKEIYRPLYKKNFEGRGVYVCCKNRTFQYVSCSFQYGVLLFH